MDKKVVDFDKNFVYGLLITLIAFLTFYSGWEALKIFIINDLGSFLNLGDKETFLLVFGIGIVLLMIFGYIVINKHPKKNKTVRKKVKK